jgi:hypothetical protein
MNVQATDGVPTTLVRKPQYAYGRGIPIYAKPRQIPAFSTLHGPSAPSANALRNLVVPPPKPQGNVRAFIGHTNGVPDTTTSHNLEWENAYSVKR